MRRSQIDAGSQPVRNAATNPSFETLTGGVAVTRTNLCPYPNMTATGAATTVRTNHCINPRGVNAYSGYGAQTITANVTGFPANPDGFTIANRVSYTDGQGNPGVMLVNPVTSGQIYTVQAWIYHESVAPTPGTGGFAQQSIASMGSPPPMTVGVWQKVTWTYTPTATNGIGFRISGQSGGSGSFLITGVMVEAAGYVSPFFDGTTTATADFTYNWTGTANASTSQEQGVLVAGWSLRWFGSTGGSGVGYKHSVDAPMDGPYFRKVWKTANTGAALDTGFSATAPFTGIVAGRTYTISAYTRSSEAQHVTIFVEWRDASGALISTVGQTDLGTLTPNVWRKFQNTLIAPTGAVSVNPIIGPYIGAIPMPAGATFDFDLVQIDEGAGGSFFTGSYPAAGDFTYVWTGTANASTSQQRGSAFAGPSNGGLASISSTDWCSTGTKSARLIPTNSTVTDTWIGVHGDTGAFRMGMQPGKTYTASAAMRLLTPQTGTLSGFARRIMFFYRNAAGSYISSMSTQAPNTVGVTKHSVTVTIPTDATEAFVRLMNGASAGNGDVWWDDFMLVEGAYTGDFIDPARNTFSKWDGAANASTSVGYPPQLLDIAGKPAMDWATIGVSAEPVVGAYDARTIYFVYESYGQPNNYQQIASYGVANSNGLNLQTSVIGNLSLAPRLDFPEGEANRTLGGLSTMRTTRRHVVAFAFRQGVDQALYCGDGGPDFTIASLVVGSGWTNGRVSLNSIANDCQGLRALVYYADHDRATRLAISRYLGNKYGASVA